MTAQNRPGRLAARTGEPNVVASHDIDDLLARVQRDGRHAGKRERERRQRHVVDPLEKGDVGQRGRRWERKTQGEPTERDGEHHEGDDAHPKAGVDDSTMHAPWIPRSTDSSRWIPATMPSSTPMAPESTHAVSMTRARARKALAHHLATGAL